MLIVMALMLRENSFSSAAGAPAAQSLLWPLQEAAGHLPSSSAPEVKSQQGILGLSGDSLPDH